MIRNRIAAVSWALLAVLVSCGGGGSHDGVENHSYARPEEVSVSHMDLDLNVDFDARRIDGVATLSLQNHADANEVYLDTWDLQIESVRDASGADLTWTLGDSLPLLGRPLVIEITPATESVVIAYHTGNDARGVQWLDPVQTLGQRQPFVYTQSQSILARSWVPCQDNPSVRFTYSARVSVPPQVMALMSASNAQEKSDDGIYEFEMPQPIPSYLLALAAGDVVYRPISDRCGVYAEPEMIDAAAWEFADTEHMIQVAEALYGPYRWDQFDMIVLPPSFPYGGMENPRLTFLTPTLIAGDRSLVSTIAHELAHSWSGNLVTNATWSDFWLNEGFTTYFERRIMERVFGPDITEMEAMLGRGYLEEEVATEPPADSLDTALYIPLGDRDPDEELGIAPYEKGYLFLRLLEENFGRPTFDEFLRGYFDHFAFGSMTTQMFVEYLRRELLGNSETLYEDLKVDEWMWRGGIPANAPHPNSSRFKRVEAQAQAFSAGVEASKLDAGGWTSQEWEHFLESLTPPLTDDRMADLDDTFALSAANDIVRRSWLKLVIASDYEPAYPVLEAYLRRVGRRWLIRPLYEELAKTEEGLQRARYIYRRAREGYHSTTQSTIDDIIDWHQPSTPVN